MIDMLQYSFADPRKDSSHRREIAQHDCRDSQKFIFNRPRFPLSASA
jgi:hypothetical protein